MAIRNIIVDDIDGTPDAQTYQLISPADGSIWEIDLAPANAKKLVDALSLFIGQGRQVEGNKVPAWMTSPTRKPLTSKTPASTRATREYDKDAFRVWAVSNGKWTGGRPKNDVIDEFEAARAT